MKIRTGDQVLILSGKDRTKRGKVIGAFPRVSGVVVEGVNMRKKHQRPKRAGQKGERIEIPHPLHVSNVKLICPKCGKPSRVGYKREGEKRYRRCIKCKGFFQ